MIISVQLNNVVLAYEADVEGLAVGDLVWLPVSARWSRPALGRVLLLDEDYDGPVKPIVAVVTPEERQTLREHGVGGTEPERELPPESSGPPLLGGF